MYTELVACTDGASRGNPGPAAIGVVIKTREGRTVASISECIGKTTNNQAEYRAVIAALEKALSLGTSAVTLKVDSELVAKQIKGLYRVKNADLKPLFDTVMQLQRRFSRFSVEYIPREQNREADALANRAFTAEKACLAEDGPSVLVRPAEAADYPAIYAVMNEIDVLHVRNLPQVFRMVDEAATITQLQNTSVEPDAVILVAEFAGEIAGFIRLRMSAAPAFPVFRPRRYAKVNDFGVLKACQRRGIGRALMQAAEKWACARRAQDIELDVWEFNQAALRFYLEAGFTGARRTLWKELKPPKS